MISLPSGKGFHGGGQAIEVEVPVLSFPFLFGGAFIEAAAARSPARTITPDFPSFSEGLSLRPEDDENRAGAAADFPSFSEGLSLRRPLPRVHDSRWHFPSFLEGLSLRHLLHPVSLVHILRFPFLSGRAFIEARQTGR